MAASKVVHFGKPKKISWLCRKLVLLSKIKGIFYPGSFIAESLLDVVSIVGYVL